MKKIFTTIILVLPYILLYAQPLSQYHNFTIKKLSQAEGLSQGSNYFLYEDKEGFMWITANDAINRYDGNWVKVYKDEKYFKGCPPLKQGYNFTEDSAGNIYVGSTIGLYRYNRKQDNFSLINIFKDHRDENCVPFTCRNNAVWCYNRFYEIAAFNTITQKITYYKDLKLDSIESLHPYMFGKTNYRTRQPFFDKQGILWIASNKVLASYNIQKKCLEYYTPAIGANKILLLTSLYYDSSFNRILFGTETRLLIFDIPNKKFIHIKINHVAITDILKLNKLYIIHDMLGTSYISDKAFKNNTAFTQKIYVEGKGITTFTLCVDRFNRIWSCKSGFGLTVFDFSDKPFFKDEGTSQDPFYFNRTGVHSFAEYPNGDVLIRSGSDFYIQHHSNFSVTPLMQNSKGGVASPITNDYQRNGIWIFAENRLILLSCKTNKPLFSIPYDYSEAGIVQDIAVLPDDEVWVSLSKGIYKIDLKQKKLVAIQKLNNPDPFKLNLLSKNRIAISYLNGNMIVADTKTYDILKIILPGIKSFYLQQDSIKNIFWLGADDGVYMLDENFKLLKKFNASNKLSGSYIYGLLLDDENNVWVSHERGLSFINSNTFQIINFDEDDDIQDRDYNNRCFFKSKNGTLYFGGIKGFNWFKPPVKIPSFYKPELYVDDIKVNNKSVFADTNYNYVQRLNLSAQQNKISIHAVIKDLDMIHSNEIIYRFKNLDSTWQYMPANSNIIFNNLAAGDYQLQLGYYSKKQQIHVAQKIIAISIALPFYKTILFWALISAAITALLVWNFNSIKLKKQKRLLAQQAALMKERSRITADLHDDVGASLSSLQINSVIAKQIMDTEPDKSKQYLDKVIEQSEAISSNIGDIIWSMKSKEDRLADLDGRIRNIISNLLGATNINYSINIEKPLEDEITNITARKNILLLIKEAANNCAKYSKATQFSLFITFDESYLNILISDDGKGIAPAKMKTGNGLQNMQKRTTELKGTMQVQTEENKGVQLKFIIPATEIRG